MAKRIQAWTEFGPRIEWGAPLTEEELIENIVAATNQSRGSVLAVLADLDTQIEAGLRAGRIVHLPNRMHFKPTGKRDGRILIDVRPNPDMERRINATFRGYWRNGHNIGKAKADIGAQRNRAHPDDPIES